MDLLTAQAGAVGVLASWLIVAVVIAGIVAIAMMAIRATGVAVPPWVAQILWIVLVVVLAIVGIRIILSVM
jgi:purine-cytosine permease-like protein